MNYFPFHVGDYAAHTGHLEPMEDLIYRRLLDVYYLREGPLPADVQVTSKLIRLRSMASDVEAVLQEFFTLTEDGWRHRRCDQEIAKMQDKQAKARTAAELSVKSRKASAERALAKTKAPVEQTLPIKPTDVELPTPTPTPKEKKDRTSSAEPFGSAPPSGFAIPLNDSTEWQVPEPLMTEWRQAFPAVDVEQELREMRQWSIANPSNRKTSRGVASFAVRWLQKAQDMPNRHRPAQQAEAFV